MRCDTWLHAGTRMTLGAMITCMAPQVSAPRPRLLAYGLSDDEVQIARSMAGSVELTDDLREVHPEEHDALILARANFHNYRQGFPRRLVFGPLPEASRAVNMIGSLEFGGGIPRASTNMVTQFRPAREVHVTEHARRYGLETLVRRSCVPTPNTTYTGFHLPVYPERDEFPLLQEVLSSPLTLAAVLEKRDTAGAPIDSAVWLPDMARVAFRDWLAFALTLWRSDDPETFPVSAEWVAADQWASPEELSARQQLNEFQRAEQQRRLAADAEYERLTRVLEHAGEEAVAWRSLLTASGDELVAAVKEALEMFGFAVVDGDALPQHKSAKREDLRVSDADWIALVEVKGYSGAAKSNDLDQIKRAGSAFARDEGRDPDALWYLPNLQRDIDPGQRGLALEGREEDLSSFAELFQGCLIDTRDLFSLRQLVVLGKLPAADARERLKQALGRFVAPTG